MKNDGDPWETRMPAYGTPKRILDRTFNYTPACRTDIRKLFARVRKERAEQQARQQDMDANKVKPIKRAK